jgi:dihydroorotase
MFDILLKNGLVVDPSQKIHQVTSIALDHGKVLVLGSDIADTDAKIIYDFRGKLVCPGLIDIHCHPAYKFADLGVPEIEIGLNCGVTILCDAGTAGAANFKAMRSFIIDPAETEVVCFLNLANHGLVKIPEILSINDINPDHSAQVIEANKDIIKGVKLRAIQAVAEGGGIQIVELAKKLSCDFNMPLMLHLGETRKRFANDKMDDFSRAAVSLLDEGDIISHYLTWEPGGLILNDGTVYPELSAARKRGVLLDSCHGLNHFSFHIARHALSQGLVPDVISTDLCEVVMSSAQSLPVVMSKFLALGLSIDQVVAMTTINPAKALGMAEQKGGLKPGMAADITVINLTEGNFVFNDGTGGEVISGDKLVEPHMVFKSGVPRPAYSRYHLTSRKFRRV